MCKAKQNKTKICCWGSKSTLNSNFDLNQFCQIFKKGADNLNLLNPKRAEPTPWIIFALPNIFKDGHISLNRLTEVEECSTLGMELMVLLAQPQANWALLLKVKLQGLIYLLSVSAKHVLGSLQ